MMCVCAFSAARVIRISFWAGRGVRQRVVLSDHGMVGVSELCHDRFVTVSPPQRTKVPFVGSVMPGHAPFMRELQLPAATAGARGVAARWSGWEGYAGRIRGCRRASWFAEKGRRRKKPGPIKKEFQTESKRKCPGQRRTARERSDLAILGEKEARVGRQKTVEAKGSGGQESKGPEPRPHVTRDLGRATYAERGLRRGPGSVM